MIRARRVRYFSLILLLLYWAPGRLDAHCDGMDGPIIKAARQALLAGDANPVLIWVQKKDEGEVKRALEQTLAVRRLSPASAELADRYFFETVVRIHRAGEGAPYTGLKPAGRDLGPAIPEADHALETGSAELLLKLLGDSVQKGIRQHFLEAMSKKGFREDDIEGGREYVKAYVEYVHYIERLYEVTSGSSHGPAKDSGPHEDHE